MPGYKYFTAMDTLLKMLDERGLKLYATLTGAGDWARDERLRSAVSDIVPYKSWLNSFLNGGRGYKNDSTIITWDLRTEGSVNDTLCNNWARAILPYLQSLDSTTEVTRSLGLSQPWGTDTVRNLGDVDIFDWHPYLEKKTIGDTGDTIVTRLWSPLPDSIDVARTHSWEHTLSFGEFGFPVYKEKPNKVDQMPEMEQRQLYRNFFYKMWELGITKANVFRIYDTPDGKRFGVYRDDRRFKPSGELIAQVFSGASWDTIPIIGNWHMELDDRLNWLNLWKPDTSCDTSTCDTCGSIQPSCWRTKVWRGTPGHISFVWDTTKNFTPDGDSVYIGFPPRASLKIAIEPPAQVTDTCEASWYFRCCEAGEKQHTAVTPGVSYTCSAYVWFEHSLDSVGLGIRWYDMYGDTISTDHNYIPGSSLTAMQWQAIDTTMPAPNGAYSCIVSCNVYSTDTCTVWFDDVQLYEPLKWKTYYPDTVIVDIGEGATWDTTLMQVDDGQYYTISGEDTSDGVWRTDWYGQVRIGEDRDDVKRLWVGYDGHYSTGDVDNPKIQTIYLMNWTTEAWDTLCAAANDTSCWNEVRKADITHGWSTADESDIQDYIDSDRYIQLRVVTEDASATYNCLADYMRFTVQFEPQ
jgi:hypothetical protein